MSDDLEKMALSCAKEINARLFASGNVAHQAFAAQDVPIILRYLERATEQLRTELAEARRECSRHQKRLNKAHKPPWTALKLSGDWNRDIHSCKVKST